MSQVRLTGSGGGNTILNGNDTITADQTFNFPNTGGTLLTGSQTETGSGGSSGSAQVVGYQQGTWVPTCSKGSLDTVAAVRWYRVGNCITLQGKLSGWPDTTAADIIDIKGIPYSNADDVTIGVVRVDKVDTGGDQIIAVVGGGKFDRVLIQKNRDGVVSAALNYSNLTAADATISFTVIYRTENTDWKPTGTGATVS